MARIGKGKAVEVRIGSRLSHGNGCGHCVEGEVLVQTAGFPMVKEPCGVCHPEEAALAWKDLQPVKAKVSRKGKV